MRFFYGILESFASFMGCLFSLLWIGFWLMLTYVYLKVAFNI